MTFVDIVDHPLHDTKFPSKLWNENKNQNIGIFPITKSILSISIVDSSILVLVSKQ